MMVFISLLYLDDLEIFAASYRYKYVLIFSRLYIQTATAEKKLYKKMSKGSSASVNVQSAL